MKVAMKFVCILVLFVGLFSMLLLFDVDNGIKEFASKVAVIGIFSLFPMLIIALTSFKLERKDNPLYKFLIGVMFVPIMVMTILIFFSESFGEDSFEFIANIIQFFFKTYIGLTLLMFVLLPESNNRVTTITQITAIGTIVLRMVMSVFQSSTIKLSGVASMNGIVDMINPLNTKNFDDTFDIVILIIEIMAIILTYISNYAFSEDVPNEVVELDYARLKEEANNITKERFEKMYNKGGSKEDTKEETSETKNENTYMNINNQLGANSNVGQVSEATKKNTKNQMTAMVQVPIMNNNKPATNAVQPQVPVAKQEIPQPVSPAAPQQAVAQHPVAQHPVAQHVVPQQQAIPQPVNNAAIVDNVVSNQPAGYSNEMAPVPQQENKFIN